MNELLAELLKNERDPVEDIKESAAKEFAFEAAIHTPTVEDLLKRGRLVRLACGHFKITKALRRAACGRCGEMIRSGWDHDGFRRLGEEDTFSWPDDPLRRLHEPEERDSGARFDPTM